MIRILHLSDFHYKPTHPEDFEDMGKKIATDVLKRLDNKSLDLIVFSGDLVYTGNKKETFEKAATALFDPIKKLTGLTNEQILLTPGNHDRVFGKELPIVKTGINLYPRNTSDKTKHSKKVFIKVFNLTTSKKFFRFYLIIR